VGTPAETRQWRTVDAGCTAAVAAWDATWNKPLSITDALGNETDLTYVVVPDLFVFTPS
jgi:hypothetical protein